MDTNSTYKHWYEVNPSRLEMEKMAMSALFPGFELVKTNIGELQYSGVLQSDKFKRSEGYTIVMEYSDGGTKNFGNPGMAVTPISPLFSELFPAESSSSNELMHKLLDDICIQNNFVSYEDPIVENNGTIITCASLLKRTVNLLVKYESESGRLLHESEKADAAARKRQELRTQLKEGFRVRISKNGFNQVEEIVFNLFSKCNAYLELLPAADHPQKIPHDWRGGFDYKLSLDSTIPPYVIIDSFDDLIDRTSMKNLQIIYKSNRNSFSYKLDIQSLRIKSIYIALIFTYFLQKADIFCFPSGGVDSLYQRKLIFSKEALMNELKRVDAKKSISDLACLTTGISDVNIPFGYSGIGAAPCSFTYYYWNDIKGYIRCYVTIIRHKEEEYIDISDIQYDEYEEALISMSECPDFDIEAKKRKLDIDNHLMINLK